MQRVAIYGLLYLLTVVVAFICLRIEWLNVAAGGRLPSREYYNDDPEQGSVTWRYSPITSEAAWRSLRGPRDANGNPLDRSLTAAETTAMASDLERAKANNTLLDFVGSAGLLQYILAPALAFASLRVIHLTKLRYGIFPLVIAVPACALMIYRTYYSSMG